MEDTPMQTAKRIEFIYKCIVAVLIVALGIALIWSCIDIYRADPTGDPYSPATISAHFLVISPLVIVTLAAIARGILFHAVLILLELVLPTQGSKKRSICDQHALMKKAAAKAGTPTGREKKDLLTQRILRRVLTISACVVMVRLMIFPAIYAIFFHDYHAPNPTTEVIKTSLIIFIPALLGLVGCYISGIFVSKSYLRSTEIYKSIKKDGTVAPVAEKPVSKIPVIIIRSSILAVAVALIVLGIFNGSARDVLTKAVAICTECIGLG